MIMFCLPLWLYERLRVMIGPKVLIVELECSSFSISTRLCSRSTVDYSLRSCQSIRFA